MITVDSSVFKQSGYRFNQGLLGQLKKFNHGRFRLVLSDIVINEVRRHVKDNLAEDLSGWPKAFRRLKEFEGITDSAEDVDEYIGALDLGFFALKSVDRFLIDTGAECVSVDHAKILDVVDMYFEGTVPFGVGKKKNEFPDAIALLGLKAWVDASGSGMIVVSNDQDWIKFCADSPSQLYAVTSLEDALKIIGESEAERDARSSAREKMLIEGWNSGGLSESAKNQLEQLISERIVPIAESGYQYSFHVIKVMVGEMRVSKPSPMRVDDSAFVLMIDLEVHFEAWLRFDFIKARGGDFVGSGSYGAGRNIKAIALLKADHESMAVEVMLTKEIELAFGEIEPDTDDVISRSP
ncbi:PIN domain-containing protein [Xanthomonas sacchari]|uniref:PIN domain-containing protein n=1 Tax=Xanthomonas sacchari TaxID=56458 RepID=UPI002435FECD|nr:PIN domain-containing protein [Xanthomonas sacchari]